MNLALIKHAINNMKQESPIISLHFKDEDEDGRGNPVGLLTGKAADGSLFRFNDGDWISYPQAEAIARRMKVPLEYF
jgi:hypothetical protein